MTDSVTLSYVAELKREVEALRQEVKALRMAVQALLATIKSKPELPRPTPQKPQKPWEGSGVSKATWYRRRKGDVVSKLA
jgi:hypothetical protein